MADHEDELVDAVRELTRTIDALRAELEGTSPRRPPLRPPTPRELLRFTDEVAVPAALAILETSVRALEAFQRSLQVVRTEREVRDRTTAAAETTSERASDLRRTTLAQLDTVLTQLQRAASDGRLPANEEARGLLAEARQLRDDVDDRLRAATEPETRTTETDGSDPDDGVTIDIEEGPLRGRGTNARDADPDSDPDPAVDVDAELETLRDQYGDDDDSGGDDETDSRADDGGSDEN